MSFAVTLGAHAATVQLNQMTHNRQPESHAAMLPARLLIRLPEAIENVWQKVGCNALAGIADHDLEMRVHSLRTNLDPPAARRELDRIGQQVPDDLLQPYG